MPGENQSQVTTLREETTAASGLSRIIFDHLKEPCNSAQGFQVAVFDKVTQWRGIHHAALRHGIKVGTPVTLIVRTEWIDPPPFREFSEALPVHDSSFAALL